MPARLPSLLFLGALLLGGAATQGDSPDPLFDGIPFEDWVAAHASGPFHWKVLPPHAALSFHQRLELPVQVELDGRDLAGRSPDSTLLFLVQITDRNGTRYRHHYSLDLKKSGEDMKNSMLQITQPAFVLPGDYQLAVAIADTRTHEHSGTELSFRVPREDEPIPGIWSKVPAVEFINEDEKPPDAWYLPSIEDPLPWADSAASRARLNVVLNVDAATSESARAGEASGGLPALLPILKVLTSSGSAGLAGSVNVLDLSRRHNVFSQPDVKPVDWPQLKTALAGANTASIDVRSLSERGHAQFFVSEVRKALRAAESPSVLVVLSTPVSFDSGEDLSPIALEALPECRAFYIRYSKPVLSNRGFVPRGRPGFGGWEGPRGMGRPMPHLAVDQLEATLKPLHPKVFDVTSPEQMAKALREIRAALVAAP